MMQRKSERGAALLMALIILLMITLVGVSALKSGMFHERMAFNAQAEELTFQSAESAINAVISEAKSSGSVLTEMLEPGAVAVVHCLSRASGLVEGDCDGDDTIDARESIQSNASSHFDAKKPLMNSDADYFMDYQFATEGHGSFIQSSMPFSTTNYQEWRKIGPSSGQFSDDLGLLGYGNEAP